VIIYLMKVAGDLSLTRAAERAASVARVDGFFCEALDETIKEQKASEKGRPIGRHF
jgi:hypothetical protein